MKTLLTAEESAKLIELGISPERASMCLLNFDYDSEVIPCEDVWEENGRLLANVNDEVIDVDRKIVPKDSDFDHSYANDNPIFTLSDLVSLLPKKITFGHRTNCRLKMQPIISSKDRISEVWQACYLHTSLKANAESPELIDALYSLLLWCLEKGYVKNGIE